MPPVTTVRRSRTIAAPVEQVFETALSTPLPELYRRRFGPMPPIVAVRDQQGAWETPGQTRVFVTGDGGRMREEMLSLDRPHRFVNRLTVLGGPFTPIVERVDESWSFRSVDGGTEATWEWNLFPRSVPARVVVPVVGRLWLGYASRVLDTLTAKLASA